jgi:hypothetical protein
MAKWNPSQIGVVYRFYFWRICNTSYCLRERGSRNVRGLRMIRRFLAGVAASCLLIIGSTAPVDAQSYLPAPNFGYSAVPNYAPPAPPTGYASQGYQWRYERGATDWRNDTWREDRFDQDWRNRNWQTRRELQDWREREDFAKSRTPNNPYERGYVECGKGAAGLSGPCGDYATVGKKSVPTEGNENAPSDGNEKGRSGNRQLTRGVEDCGHGSVWRRC